MSYGRRTADKLITSQLNMNLPHLHARYAEFEASVNLSDGEVLAGTLPRKQLRLVQAWIELHRDELMADWELARSGELPYNLSTAVGRTRHCAYAFSGPGRANAMSDSEYAPSRPADYKPRAYFTVATPATQGTQRAL